MDMSDEKTMFDSWMMCPMKSATAECDDRSCRPFRWYCGDGQCIPERIPFLSKQKKLIGCANRRDQYFWREEVLGETLRTLPNGRCTTENFTDEADEHVRCAH